MQDVHLAIAPRGHRRLRELRLSCRASCFLNESLPSTFARKDTLLLEPAEAGSTRPLDLRVTSLRPGDSVEVRSDADHWRGGLSLFRSVGGTGLYASLKASPRPVAYDLHWKLRVRLACEGTAGWRYGLVAGRATQADTEGHVNHAMRVPGAAATDMHALALLAHAGAGDSGACPAEAAAAMTSEPHRAALPLPPRPRSPWRKPLVPQQVYRGAPIAASQLLEQQRQRQRQVDADAALDEMHSRGVARRLAFPPSSGPSGASHPTAAATSGDGDAGAGGASSGKAAGGSASS